MPQKVYLDDNGEPVAAASKVYLDDAGEPIGATKETAKPEKSIGGFLSNIASSGGRFLKDTVEGIPAAAGMVGKAAMMLANPAGNAQAFQAIGESAPRIASVAGQGLKNRYGGLEQIKDTLYNDPVGVAADLSTLAGGVGLAAKAGGAGKLARIANVASEATNPMRAITAPAAKLAHEAGVTAIRGTLRPQAALRADFGGSRGIAEGVLKDRVFSEASAGRKLERSVAQADKMLADAQATGTPGVSRVKVARAVVGEPRDTAKLRTRLGVPDETPALTETAKGIFRNNPSDIPLTDAQAMKREAQKLAYEAGADNLTVKKAAETAKAKALRAGIEERVPEVGPVNARSQRLVGAKQAFQQAEDRPRALTAQMGILGGVGGFTAGGPIGAIAIPALMKLATDSPRVGALAGIATDTVGRAVNSAEALRAALIARFMGGDE